MYFTPIILKVVNPNSPVINNYYTHEEYEQQQFLLKNRGRELSQAIDLPREAFPLLSEKHTLESNLFDFSININRRHIFNEDDLKLQIQQRDAMEAYLHAVVERLNLIMISKVGKNKRGIEVIFAMSKNKVFGQDNGLPWKCKRDMERFKELTMGHTVIMGSKTFASLPKTLHDRLPIVVSSKSVAEVQALNPNVYFDSLESTLEKAIEFASLLPESKKIFVIGGKELLRKAIPLADVLHVSLIMTEPPINEDTVVLDFIDIVSSWQFSTVTGKVETADSIWLDQIFQKDANLDLRTFAEN